MQYAHFQNWEICFLDDLPSRQEEYFGHDLQTGLLHMKTTNGQGLGGVSGHLHLTRRGASALLGQAPHQSDPRRVAARWCYVLVNDEIKR